MPDTIHRGPGADMGPTRVIWQTTSSLHLLYWPFTDHSLTNTDMYWTFQRYLFSRIGFRAQHVPWPLKHRRTDTWDTTWWQKSIKSGGGQCVVTLWSACNGGACRPGDFDRITWCRTETLNTSDRLTQRMYWFSSNARLQRSLFKSSICDLLTRDADNTCLLYFHPVSWLSRQRLKRWPHNHEKLMCLSILSCI